MKQFLFSIFSIFILMFFNGCGGLETTGIGSPRVSHNFQTGKVVSVKKVIIDRTLETTAGATVAGAAIGALTNSNHWRGAGMGALIGGATGLIGGKMIGADEKVTYETHIQSYNGVIYKTFLERPLRVGTIVEFVERDGKITNVDIR